MNSVKDLISRDLERHISFKLSVKKQCIGFPGVLLEGINCVTMGIAISPWQVVFARGVDIFPVFQV